VNIRKVVFYLFSCNFAEVLTLLAAGIAGLPLPLLPLQILWLNLVTDTFPALALAMEPADTDVMRRPPRDSREEILSRSFLLDVLFYDALLTASTLAAFGWELARPDGHPTTVAFMTLVLAQVFHLGNARSRGPVMRASAALSNPYGVGALVLSIALQIAPMYLDPLARILRVAPLTAPEWLVVIACFVGHRGRRAGTEARACAEWTQAVTWSRSVQR
jgi:Ca2+-transporting ATPase